MDIIISYPNFESINFGKSLSICQRLFPIFMWKDIIMLSVSDASSDAKDESGEYVGEPCDGVRYMSILFCVPTDKCEVQVPTLFRREESCPQ